MVTAKTVERRRLFQAPVPLAAPFEGKLGGSQGHFQGARGTLWMPHDAWQMPKYQQNHEGKLRMMPRTRRIEEREALAPAARTPELNLQKRWISDVLQVLWAMEEEGTLLAS